MDGDVYLTDGPYITKQEDGKLYMTWSSWSENGYAVGVAVSDSGLVQGPWRQEPVPIFPAGGGKYMAVLQCRKTVHTDEGKQLQKHGYDVAPCSMKTVAGIVSGYSDNLLLRAADVMMKERRKLVLVARESPLSTVHLRNLCEASQLGAAILPPMLTYYDHPSLLREARMFSSMVISFL